MAVAGGRSQQVAGLGGVRQVGLARVCTTGVSVGWGRGCAVQLLEMSCLPEQKKGDHLQHLLYLGPQRRFEVAAQLLQQLQQVVHAPASGQECRRGT